MNRKLVKDFMKFWKLSVWEYNKDRYDYDTANKNFNTYKEGLDLEFLREYHMEQGEVFDES